MAIPFGKPTDLIFNTWAISWSDTLNSSLVHRAFFKSGLQQLMYLFVCVSDPTAFLFCRCYSFRFQKAKSRYLVIAPLFFHFGIVKASSVNPRWCSGL